MPKNVRVKICGLSSRSTVLAAVEARADYLGFVFFPKSPRFVTPQQCSALTKNIPKSVTKVALVVDPDDVLLESILAYTSVDMIQLQGHETPERVEEVKQRTGLSIMKAVGLSERKDLSKIESYVDVADQLLIDAAPPKESLLPGGNGVAFDWHLLKGHSWAIPWMLAGGLTSKNVSKALSITGALQIDVSSGVENSPGQKDIKKISSFVKNAKGLAS